MSLDLNGNYFTISDGRRKKGMNPQTFPFNVLVNFRYNIHTPKRVSRMRELKYIVGWSSSFTQCNDICENRLVLLYVVDSDKKASDP